MISTFTVIACLITFAISMILPLVILFVFLAKRRGQGVGTAWLLGATGFFVVQMVIRVPLLNIFASRSWYQTFASEHYLLYCLILGFTAAGFELIARYTVAKRLVSNLSFDRALAAGFGHGGIEAMAIVGITYINNLIYLFLIRSGAFDAMVAQSAAAGVDVSQLAIIRDSLINTSGWMFLLAGYERLLTMITHAAMTVLVCYGVKVDNTKPYILFCLAVHMFMDSFTGIVNGMATGYLGNVLSQNAAYCIIYTVLTLIAAGAVAVLCKYRRKWMMLAAG